MNISIILCEPFHQDIVAERIGVRNRLLSS